MVLTIIVLVLTVLAALWTVVTKGLIRSALGLAALSILVTILMFMLGADLAAVFELSVCAGLITVVFVSTISMTEPSSKPDPLDKTRKLLRQNWYLPIILVTVGAVLAFFSIGIHVNLPPAAPPVDVKDFLWKSRQTDLLGQIVIILAGAFGVVVLFKERKK